MVLADSGEDAIVSCNACEYAANVEKAEARASDSCARPPATAALEKVATPDRTTIADVADFLACRSSQPSRRLICSNGEGALSWRCCARRPMS